MLTGPQKRTAGHELLVDDPLAQRLVQDGPARWVVVDDLVGDNCELAISPWPRLTNDGLLTFAKSEEQHIVAMVSTEWLHDLVCEARRMQFRGKDEPGKILDRPLRVGDTFAAWITVSGHDDDQAPPGGQRAVVDIKKGAQGIADISAHSRVFAKVQVAVADAAPIDAELLPELRADEPEEVEG